MTPPSAASARFWVGCYTADAGRDGHGIGALELAPDGTPTWLGTAITADSPSFVAPHPTLHIVYAVAERAETVSAYRITTPAAHAAPAAPSDAATSADTSAPAVTLEPFGDPWPAGAAACHARVAPDGRHLVVACWGDGQVLLYELGPDGAIVSRIAGEAASDPHAEAARASAHDLAEAGIEPAEPAMPPRISRAHASLVLPDGRILTTDLGYDLARIWKYTPAPAAMPGAPATPTGAPAAPPGTLTPAPGTLTLDYEIILPFGSGPRHLVRHRSGTILIVTEYSIEIVRLAEGASGQYNVVGIGPATNGGSGSGDSAAEIALSSDHRFAYVGVRGSNLISTLQIDERGAVHPVADTPSGALWPRHHAVTPTHLLVANERSNDITAFALDPSTGLPEAPLAHLPTGSPTALVAM